MTRFIVASALIICRVLLSSGQTVQVSVCRSQRTCGECQSAGPECHWCSDVPFNGSRCDLSENLQDAGCQRKEFMVSKTTIPRSKGLPVSDSVLLSPRRVDADVVKGRPVVFTAQVKLPQSSRRRRVTLRTRNVPDHIDVTINSNCLRSRGSNNRRTCPSVNPGSVVQFQVEVSVNRCVETFSSSIHLKASGIRGILRVFVVDVCSCLCEIFGALASSDPSGYCHDNGETVCGLCHCHQDYVGDRCQCRSGEYDAQCRPEQGITEVCSGRGDCVCGECHCHKGPALNSSSPRFSGRYCDCDNHVCPAHDSQICGGPSRGRCMCGQCVCEPGHSGSACEIGEGYNSSCLAENGVLCNGHGMCHGGVCECEGPWSGPACQECPTCMERCESLRSCVECWVYQTGPITTPQECQTQCSALGIAVVDNIEETNVGRTICSVHDEADRRMAYSYVYAEDGSMVVLVNRPVDN